MQPFSGYFQIGYSGTRDSKLMKMVAKCIIFDQVKFFFNLDFRYLTIVVLLSINKQL